jgi:phosphatidylethanolamine-binding protein (PEBP) family uncharacterized protein
MCSSRAPAEQAWGPEFKLQYQQEKKIGMCSKRNWYGAMLVDGPLPPPKKSMHGEVWEQLDQAKLDFFS